MALLEALATSDSSWRYGYELAEVTGIASGTLYPALIRLAERGYLDSRWEMPEPPGRPRHVYRLTDRGGAYTHRWSRPARADSPLRPLGDPV
jgi:DNA-binding PadR family transcriptional regulator